MNRNQQSLLRSANRLLKAAEKSKNFSGAASLLGFINTLTKPQTPADEVERAEREERSRWVTQMLPDEEADVVRACDLMDATKARVLARLGDPAGERKQPVVHPPVVYNVSTGSSPKKGSSIEDEEPERVEIVGPPVPPEHEDKYDVEIDE